MDSINLDDKYPKVKFAIVYPVNNPIKPFNNTDEQEFRCGKGTTLLEILEKINSGIEGITPELTDHVKNYLPSLKSQNTPANKILIESSEDKRYKTYKSLNSPVEEGWTYYLNPV